jgi:hypothetical protein
MMNIIASWGNWNFRIANRKGRGRVNTITSRRNKSGSMMNIIKSQGGLEF